MAIPTVLTGVRELAHEISGEHREAHEVPLREMDEHPFDAAWLVAACGSPQRGVRPHRREHLSQSEVVRSSFAGTETRQRGEPSCDPLASGPPRG